VGYPETVNAVGTWPKSAEHYNSCLMVNGEGETIVNYRQTFLAARSEEWALESDEGFFDGILPTLGATVLGIGMDLKYVPLLLKQSFRSLSWY
jgi:predicted amidohydrolase